MSTPGDHLSHVDEHATTVEASPAATWEALLRVVEASFGSARTARVARMLGCADLAADGPRPLASGSTIPGFHVAVAEPPDELALLGRHRFSDYALTFRLDPVGPGTRLRAETRAEFPGLRGEVYRTLVIRTHGHVLVTRRILAAVKRRAERS